jgi:mRNA interferase RelE/StbE
LKRGTKTPEKSAEDMSESFKIFETDRFIKDLEGDFSGQKNKINKKLRSQVYPALRSQPYFGINIKKLIDFKPPTWRYRIGNYRFFYTIDAKEKTVFMIKISSRADAY